MGGESIEGGMIEIGDPAEESTAPASEPRVVIEYRDRGVPWALVPPMLVLSAVAAILAYPRLVPERSRPIPPRVEQARAELPELLDDEPSPATENPKPADPVAPTPPASPAPTATPVLGPEAPADPAPPPAEPTPFPRVANLGFDPKALEAAREPAPPVDADLAPAAGPEPRPDPVARAQPAEVDPELLPPDPKLARLRREQRVAEARQQAEAERGRFHAELRAICRKSGPRSVPEIIKLCNRYNSDLDAAIKQKAARLLGKAGSHEGAGREVRINLLRSLGFPEPAILGDLLDHQRLWESDAARDGIGSKEEALYQAAVLLLNYPPHRVATATRPVSRSRPGSADRASAEGSR